MVGARAPGTEQISQRVFIFLLFLTRTKKEKWLFLKDALWGGRGGVRGVPTGAGLVDGGVDQQGRVGLVGKGWVGTGAGCKGFGSGGVSGRDTGPRDGANFATCVVFLMRRKRRKMAFFEGCPVGWGGVPTGAGLVDGEVDQGPWLQERVGGGVGAMAVPKKGEGWGLVGCRAGKGWLGGRGGVQGLRFRA